MAVSEDKIKAIKLACVRGLTVPLIANLTGLKGSTVKRIISKNYQGGRR